MSDHQPPAEQVIQWLRLKASDLHYAAVMSRAMELNAVAKQQDEESAMYAAAADLLTALAARADQPQAQDDDFYEVEPGVWDRRCCGMQWRQPMKPTGGPHISGCPALAARADQQKAQDGWQPIETLPIDVNHGWFLVWAPESRCTYAVVARNGVLFVWGAYGLELRETVTLWRRRPQSPDALAARDPRRQENTDG